MTSEFQPGLGDSTVGDAGSGRIVPMRLQKFLARAGAASRRGSENLMTAGRVTVNGSVVTELGSKVDPAVDEVAVDGVVVRLQDGPTTIMLHKPAGVITTMKAQSDKPIVAQLVPVDRYPGLYPIGRLDADTTGLLLFSTDGELGNALLHPRHHVEKSYLALVEGPVGDTAIGAIARGVELDDGPAQPAELSVLSGKEASGARACFELPPDVRRKFAGRLDALHVVRLVIREGRYHQVKRMLASVGHPVLALHREGFGPLELGGLPRGCWRVLSEEEVSALHEC